MAFDGLWEGFKWPDGTVLRTFTIITTNANETVRELHNRMPVILEQQDWPTWLGEVEGDPAALLRPAGDDLLRVWPVSKQVNSPRNNGAELLEAIEDTASRRRDLRAVDYAMLDGNSRSTARIPFFKCPETAATTRSRFLPCLLVCASNQLLIWFTPGPPKCTT